MVPNGPGFGKVVAVDAEKQAVDSVRSEAESPKGPPGAYYFLSLEVENVRCFKDAQTLPLADSQGRPKRWTVLLGDNGLGKTTLLQVLASFQSELRRLPGMGPQTPPLSFPRVHVGDTSKSAARFLRTGASEMACKAALCHGARLMDPGRAGERLDLVVRLREDGNTSCNRLFPSGAGPFVCYGYGASRRMSARALAESRSEDTCKTLFDEAEPLMNAEEWLLQADYAALSSDSEPAKRQRDQIKDILARVLPDVTELRIRAGEGPRKSFAVEARTPFGWVPLRNLSSGYRSLIAWIVDLAARLFEAYPDSPNPLAEPAVVLVDQIDLFLHPKWQLKLINHLVGLFPNAQFIASAHSPLIVQAAEDTNIVVLRREGDHVVIDRDPERVRGWRVDQVLTSDLFGLSTTRDERTEDLLKERRSLLSKSALTRSEQERLKQLDEQVAGLPFVESPQDVEAMELIRKAAEKLRQTAEVK
jgi:energy-coupling factor transporter ATP-binding protein EcfA2